MRYSKKLIGLIVLVVLAVGLLGAGSALGVGRNDAPASGVTVLAQDAASANVPSVVVIPNANVLSKDTKIVISGAGFNPKQEVVLLLQVNAPDVGFQTNDIWDELTPKPVANERGCWTTVWNCSTYVGKKFVGEGVYTLYACELNTYKVLATAPVIFADTSKPADQWPAWAKLVFPTK